MLAAAGIAAEKQDASLAGELQIELALYFTPEAATDPVPVLARLLAEPGRRLAPLGEQRAGALGGINGGPVPLAQYQPPDAHALQFKGEGVAPAMAKDLAAAKEAFVVVLTAKRSSIIDAYRAQCQLMADLAKETGAVIWDEETRQVFSREQWQKRRLEGWDDGVPDVRDHVTMHAYANPDLLRIITLGMGKFGLPDFVFSGIPRQQSRPFGNLLNVLAQRFVEGQRATDRKLTLTLADIRHPAARKDALANPGKNAVGKVVLALSPITPEDGDPRNTILGIDFPESKARQPLERAMWGADRLYGSTVDIINARQGDTEMLAARDRARKAFFAQEQRFRAGLQLGERLVVKAPFSLGENTEYMWVEVVSWGKAHIDGVLMSNPRYVKTVRPGSKVEVPFADIYDYIFYKPDGTEEGNETGKVLEARQKK